MSRDEKGEDVVERMSKRFGDDDNPDTPDNLDNPDTPEQTEDPDKGNDPDTTESVDGLDPKEAWTGRNIYVPDGEQGPDMLTAFDGEFDRVKYETDWEVRKQTHYYPVVIQHGVDALQEMDGDEFTAAVDELGLR
jgi:hypothetical protein